MNMNQLHDYMLKIEVAWPVSFSAVGVANYDAYKHRWHDIFELVSQAACDEDDHERVVYVGPVKTIDVSEDIQRINNELAFLHNEINKLRQGGTK